ncbi:MAG: 6-bladed beta-propeller [Rikenellaceae bacterium]|nr:6-bladed beta-propeller [Rikenellaceae bacterium]MCL2691939.1 6-bladed beta-propeller [Rikenellaceae bacterium]
MLTKNKTACSLLFVISFLVCFVQCRKSEQNLYVSEIIYPLEQTRLISDFKPYIESIIVIPIQESDQSLMSYISKALLDNDGNIYILDKGRIIALKPDGTFLRRIGRIGQGPREYLNIEDIAISDDGEYLMVLQSLAGNILLYGIKDTTLYKEIAVPLIAPFDALAPAREGAWLYAAFPASQSDYGKLEPMITRIDNNANIIEQHLPRKDFTMSIGNITQVSHNNYLLKPQSSEHIVYRLMPDSMSACYKIDFGRKNIPPNWEKDLRDVQSYMHSPYFKSPMFFQETDSLLYFKAAGPQAQGYNFLYLRGKGKGIHWVDNYSNFLADFIASDADYFYVVIPPLQLVEDMDDLCPLSKYLTYKTGVDRDPNNNNPVIVKIKFNIP